MQSTMEQVHIKEKKTEELQSYIWWVMSYLKEDSHNKAPVRCDRVRDHSAVVYSLKLLFGISPRSTCERERHSSLILEEQTLKGKVKAFEIEIKGLNQAWLHCTSMKQQQARRQCKQVSSERWKKEDKRERAGRTTDRVKLLQQCWVGVRVWIVARCDAGLTGTDGFLSPPVLLVLQAQSVESCFA